ASRWRSPALATPSFGNRGVSKGIHQFTWLFTAPQSRYGDNKTLTTPKLTAKTPAPRGRFLFLREGQTSARRCGRRHGLDQLAGIDRRRVRPAVRRAAGLLRGHGKHRGIVL